MSSKIWRAGLGFGLCLLWGSVRSTESGSPPEGPIHLVHDFFPDESEGDVPPSQLTRLGNTQFFVGTDVETGQTVWRTDGTSGGTRQVPLVGYDGAVSSPVIAGRLGSRVLWTTGAVSGGVLWAATEQGDGTALRTYRPNGAEHIPFEILGLTGTGRLQLQNGDTNLSSIAALGKLGDLALVLDIGGSLWTTDGTGEARFIKQLATDPNQIFQVRGVGPPVSLGSQTFLFRRVPDSDDPSRADLELWRTDGTAAGTLRLASIPFDKDSIPYPNPTVVGGSLFFRFLGTL